MKKWPWHIILVCVGWLLIVAGIAPGAYVLVRLGAHHDQKALSIPISLKRGEIASPYFTADANNDYQVDLNWNDFPARQTDVELDWRVETEHGQVLQRGSFGSILRGSNFEILGQFRPNPGQRQRIVLDIHQDVEGTSTKTNLEAILPDTTGNLSYAIPFVAGCAAFLALPGAVLLIVVLIVGAARRKKPAVAA